MTTPGCTDPGAVAPEDLLAYADGAARPEVVQHIAACPACAAEAAGYARLQGVLGALLYRFDCPPVQTLGEYELGLVTPEVRTEIAGHLLECPHCMAEVQQLRAVLKDGPLGLPEGRPGVLQGLRRLVATLFVPESAPVAVALRGPAEGGAQTYRAEGWTITLGPGPAARRGHASLMGLIVREDGDLEAGDTGTARLVGPAGVAATAEIDELGNFAFDDVVPGSYGLELSVRDVLVVVEAFAVGAP